MKEVKKIKIIEAGRICSPEELKEIRGGFSGSGIDEGGSGCNYTTGCNTHESCGWFSYETCKQVSVSYGYESSESGILCNAGYYYASCGFRGRNHTTCGGEDSYASKI